MKRAYDIYYIYLIQNMVNGKTYIGQRKCPKNKTPETDYYMGSGVYLRSAKKKWGIRNFRKSILEVCETKDEVDFLEKRYIRFYRLAGWAEYNIASGGEGGSGVPMSEERKAEQSVKMKGDKFGIGNKGPVGQHWNLSSIQKQHHSEAGKGKMSAEARQRLIEKNKDPEFRKKVSAGLRKYWAEHSYPEEARRKIGYANSKRKETMTEQEYYLWREREKIAHKGQRPKGQASKGKKWYNNGTEERYYADGEVPGGWTKGRLRQSDETRQKLANQSRGRHCYNNGERNIFIKDYEPIPEGFVPGRYDVPWNKGKKNNGKQCNYTDNK